MTGLIHEPMLVPTRKSEFTPVPTEALREARRLLERGWCQHASSKEEQVGFFPFKTRTHYCLSAAMVRAGVNISGMWFREALRQEVGALSVIGFNDNHNRSKKEVLALVDRLIERSERDRATT